METNSKINVKTEKEKKEDRIIRLSLLAFRDELTHLFNRRNLKLRLPEVLENARQNRERVSLLLIDVDEFKKINDCYFHSEGDRVLVEVARLLKREKRPQDIVVRYGGDEFVVVLHNPSSFDAQRIASRWIKDTLSITVGHFHRTPIFLSFGIATFPDSSYTIEKSSDIGFFSRYLERLLI